MHTLKRKTTALLLVVAMLFSLLPAFPQTAEASEPTEHQYVTLDYESGGLVDDKIINVNVYIDDASTPVQTISVGDANMADNRITVTVVDPNYEIAGQNGVSYVFDSGATFGDIKLSSDLKEYSGLWNAGIGKSITIDVHLRTPKGTPETPNGIYDGVLTVEFRAYTPEILKILYSQGVDVNGNTKINNVTMNFRAEVPAYGLDEPISTLPPNLSLDYRYASLSNASQKAVPGNVDSLTIDYDDGQSITVPGGELKFVLDKEDAINYYSIEAASAYDNIHIVTFYNETNGQAANHYDRYDVRFVEHGQAIGAENMPADPTYGAGSQYVFINWASGSFNTASQFVDGKVFLGTSVVNSDLNVYAQKLSSSKDGGTEIHVMNTDNQLLERLVEKYNEANDSNITVGDIDKDTLKVRVTDTDGLQTNEAYYENKWKDDYGYYYVSNL